MNKREAPEIPGWIAISLDDTIREGDRFVRFKGVMAFPGWNIEKHTTPLPSSYWNSGSLNFWSPSTLQQYAVYRRDGPRILPGNRHYATPLPLP